MKSTRKTQNGFVRQKINSKDTKSIVRFNMDANNARYSTRDELDLCRFKIFLGGMGWMRRG